MMSNRARRMALHHLRHSAGGELNLIPLIDILSVLVAFLLVYSTEVEMIQNSKGIQIPQSVAQTAPDRSVVVMITRTELFVQGERIGSVADLETRPDAVTGPLRAALQRSMPPAAVTTDPSRAAATDPPPEVTIMADKSLPYEVLKQVMSACTAADYGRISLAVLQKEKPVAAGRLPGA